MKSWLATGLAVAALCFVSAASADDTSLTFGGDQFSAGQTVVLGSSVANDAFAAGYDTSLTSPVAGSAHLAGYAVKSRADVSKDLYAAGYSVLVEGAVGGSITAIGNTVNLRSTSEVPGNVRLGGATVVVDTPVGGSALITAQSLTLNSAVSGDLRFYGETIVFGPNAKVAGQVSVSAPDAIAIPASVASADRVSYQKLEANEQYSGTARTFGNVGGLVSTSSLVWLLLLAIAGAAAIGFAPRGWTAMEGISAIRPFRSLGFGIVALAAIIGFIPVFALTLIGIPLVPIVLLLIILVCSFGFLSGVYFAALTFVRRFMPIDTKPRQLGVLVVALVAATVLGMIPFVGWISTLMLLCYGLGLAALAFLARSRRIKSPPSAAVIPVAV
jgi:hypothetical protein